MKVPDEDVLQTFVFSCIFIIFRRRRRKSSWKVSNTGGSLPRSFNRKHVVWLLLILRIN